MLLVVRSVPMGSCMGILCRDSLEEAARVGEGFSEKSYIYIYMYVYIYIFFFFFSAYLCSRICLDLRGPESQTQVDAGNPESQGPPAQNLGPAAKQKQSLPCKNGINLCQALLVWVWLRVQSPNADVEHQGLLEATILRHLSHSYTFLATTKHTLKPFPQEAAILLSPHRNGSCQKSEALI